LFYSPKHSHAKKRPVRNRLVGAAIAGTATLVTGVSLGGPAQAGSVWDAVAACESGGNWAISTGNGFSGGLQFTSQTWNAFGGARYASSANQAGKAAQIATAKRVLASQGPGAWPVCSQRAGLTRANGGAASAGQAAATSASRSSTRTTIAVPSSWAAASLSAGRLATDGVMGPMTTRAVQRWVGTTQDGAFGPISTRALQRKVGVSDDGAIGPQTVRALQARIGARRDGASSLNSSTVVRLQSHLNSR
jgi:resuscitation-promoting factor RpfA